MRKQLGLLEAVRVRRDGAAGERANLMPVLLDCARAHASEGEIIQSLQQVFGTYTESPVF